MNNYLIRIQFKCKSAFNGRFSSYVLNEMFQQNLILMKFFSFSLQSCETDVRSKTMNRLVRFLRISGSFKINQISVSHFVVL